MNLLCFECKGLFPDINITINHMRKVHNILDNTGEIKCIANYRICKKTFVTYSGMRKHLTKCMKLTCEESVVQFSEVFSFDSIFGIQMSDKKFIHRLHLPRAKSWNAVKKMSSARVFLTIL